MIAATMLQLVVQSAVAVLAVWLIVRCVPGLRPNLRAWLWRLAALKCLWTICGPVPLPILPAAPLTAPAASVSASAITNPIASAAPALEAPAVPLLPDEAPVDYLKWALGSLWGVGTLVGLARLARAIRRSAPLRKQASTDLPVGNELASRLGLRRMPRVVLCADAAGPMLVGLLRPVVVLPESLPMEERSMAIAHELAHVRRYDALWALALRLVSIAFWFVPPIAWAGKAALDASEEACDAEALRVTQADPARYAQMLIDCARTTRAPYSLSLGLSSAHSLKTRIKTMLQPSSKLRAWHVAALLPFVVALVPLSAVARPAGQEPAKERTFELLQMERYLLNLPSVKRGLKVTPLEEKQMREIWLRSLKRIRALGDELAELEKKQASNRVRFELDKDRGDIFREEWTQTLAVLTPEQRARLRQMVLQYNGERTMAYPEVAEAMRLSPEKRERITLLVKSYRDRVRKLQSEIVGPGIDLSRLTLAERKRYLELKEKMLDATGEERKQVLNEYWPLFQKTWTRKIVTRAELQGSSAKHERNRKLSLVEKAKTNAEILALLTPEERQRWRTLIGPKATFDVLPYAWG